ncbi:triose-phosphate isomerase [Pseudonocardia alni]|jgi:triosephosphate isomerase|uniref:Triosephosphate isomerase n=1 Tax=Pseudonocardia alni TaxID=33907 RepID=A0A852W7N9_PSEA5|nr:MULTISPECIES: triose-phosphate isomerase [Pseudonocardia]NWJ70254.1 triose-phosphate isomerase [Pseudonocardia pini]OJG07242.1 Triosephosphate isomerase [Pseudonocardia autotrophica]ALE77715.1 triosephosphate isomerase [Pseudonocardia sp. AL041005-10]MCM3844839.1 triose-phosphate isomerase [Pseudonocardia sp. DR1-2]MCO7193946.1 triose-phosphate isomerase [Pseudonocardia sp. McavD-2-B]
MATRKPLIAGNWKMNLNHLEAIAVVQKLAFALPDRYLDKVEVAVLPPFTDIRSVQTLIDGDKLRLVHGAQDLSPHDSGAYTGDVSGVMLAKLGCTYVAVGHSERREIHGEDDAVVNAKVLAALKHGITPILCVGEGLDVREAGTHVQHCTDQLRGALKGVTAEQAAGLVLAYEPVWAIGTGKVAGPADAQEVCAALRATLAELYSDEVAGTVRVLYGGSVKSSNVGEIVAQTDVDGALVGGASLDAEEFAKLSAIAAGGPLP